MRLTRSQSDIIRSETTRLFGNDAVVLLFGSRADDSRKGGDIDLHIDTHLPPDQAQLAASRLYARLQRRLGEQRIDIVTHSPEQPLRPIDLAAQQGGVQL